MKIVKKAATTGLSAVAISLLIGGAAASACSMNGYDDGQSAGWQNETSQGNHEYGNGETAGYDNNMDEQQHHEWHMKLDAALREHAAVGVAALKAEALKEPDIAALNNTVDQNSMIIADLVEEGYPGTHDEFLALWQSHIGYYKEYLAATLAKDEAGKQQAKEKLVAFTEETSQLLANNGNEELDESALQQSLAMHGDQVTTIIDDFVAGNYDAAWTTAHEAYEHMGMVAQMLADSAHHNGTSEDDEYMQS
ncbi:MAG TPA: hypothetical protein VLF43_04515 [Candidatus Saccharimonadales bacterium]|nr:hypothetical protein [Candidatus Saccharimonadales bacterium]